MDKASFSRAAASGAAGLGAGTERSEVKPQVRRRKALADFLSISGSSSFFITKNKKCDKAAARSDQQASENYGQRLDF